VVQRYGGTLSQFTGDGIMAVFGAPITLEDHAVRACLAALGIQEEAKRLAVEVKAHDEVVLVDPTKSDGIERGKARRAQWAAWALIQEAVGEPDIDRGDADAIARVVDRYGPVWGPIYAGCHTGTSLDEYNDQHPDERWWASHAPEHWPDHAVDRAGALRDKAKIRSQVCPDCGYIHAGECP
jgi:hypothetical protein